MNITHPNDIFVATINNPGATTYDLMSLDLSPENTGLLTEDEYKQSEFIKDKFTDSEGKFDELAFNQMFTLASQHYEMMGNDAYIKNLGEIEYSPFDLTRPLDAKTFQIEVEYFKDDRNPYKSTYGHTSVFSVDESEFSQRELAQRGKIYDHDNDRWLDKSANDLSFWNKIFGGTLVYATWDKEGFHTDLQTGREVFHQKGEWKVNHEGDFYTEYLGSREIYGKQIVNPSDLLTTDGSFSNQFDFFDTDGRTKSIPGLVMKTAVEIAPFLIPGFNKFYAGAKAAVGLTAVLPTFYKSFESILLGDKQTSLNSSLTGVEGYMAKYRQKSHSDEGMESFFNLEQIAGLTVDVFSQIHEQRALASLSKYFINADKAKKAALDKYSELLPEVTEELFGSVTTNKLSLKDMEKIQKLVLERIPGLQSLAKNQSNLSKALSLGYMSLISTSDVYEEALAGGYSRRTAGFASLASATALYGLMANNRMGDWFLDETTGYTKETNRVLARKAMDPYLNEIEKSINGSISKEASKSKLANIFRKVKATYEDVLLSPSALAENMWKNAFIEGIEEVTEEVVQDAVKGIIDTLSYLGIEGSGGSFGIKEMFTTTDGLQEALQRYVSNFAGGLLGGAMFEFERGFLSKYIDPKMYALQADTQKSLIELVANGEKSTLISIANRNRKKLGNNYVAPYSSDSDVPKNAQEFGVSQADYITDTMIGIINNIEGVLDAYDLKVSDNDIIKRAVLDNLVIEQLESYRSAENPIGIEGIIISDLNRYRNKIVEIDSKIKAAKEQNVDADVTNLEKELKVYQDKANSILKGENASLYFTKMMAMLNKNVFSHFLTLDLDSYTRNTYGVSFNVLPPTGVGLTKEQVTKEWQEMVDNKELADHLDTVVNAYLEWEQQLNPTIKDYVETGYSKVRSDVYKNVIDLNKTLDLFYTAESPADKERAVHDFIEINNHFRDLGIETMLTWDVLHNDIGKEFANQGLVQKIIYKGVDADGNPIIDQGEYTAEELEKVSNNISESIKHLPTNPLDVSTFISMFNSASAKAFETKLNKISELEGKENKTDEENEELEFLKGDLSYTTLLDLSQTPENVQLAKEHHEIKINLLQEFGRKAGLGDDTKAVEELLDKFKFVRDNDGITDKITLGEDGVLTVNQLNSLSISNILLSTIMELKGSDESLNSFITDLDFISTMNPESEDFINKLKEVSEKYKTVLDVAIERYNSSVDVKNNKEVAELHKEVTLNNSNLNKNIEKNKPDFFKLRNYTLDFLLKYLEQGGVDNELYLEVQKTVEDLKKSIAHNLAGHESAYVLIELAQDEKALESFIDVIEENDSSDTNIYSDTKMDETDPISSLTDKYSPEIISAFESVNRKTEYVAAEKVKSISKDLSTYSKELELISRFNALSNTLSLKKNPLYDFIRDFSVTLNSSGEVSKILDILQREEMYLLQASSVSSYVSEDIRDDDIKQTLNVLEAVKAVTNAMSTTELSYGDPYGLIYTRQEFAKRNNITDPVTGLYTIGSDVATLMTQDLDRIINRLKFMKQLGDSNAGKTVMEQEIIRDAMEDILLKNWKLMSSKLPRSILPEDRIDSIMSSEDSNGSKLMQIEDLFYELNSLDKSAAAEAILNNFTNLDPNKTSRIDKDVNIGSVSEWDLALYFISNLIVKSSDWNKLSRMSLDKYNKAPFYTQELVSRIVRASTIDPSLFSKMLEKYYDPSKQNANFITFVRGRAGTGKTSAVFGLNLEFFRLTNNNTILRVVAPTTLQTDNLNRGIVESVGEESLDITKLNKSALYEQLGIADLMNTILSELSNPDSSRTMEQIKNNVKVEGKTNQYIARDSDILRVVLPSDLNTLVNFDNLPNLVLIDEVTHFSAEELIVLNAISVESFYRDSSNFMKIIAAGDPTQLGYQINYEGAYFSHNIEELSGIFTPVLYTSIRSSSAVKRGNADALIGIVDVLVDAYRNQEDRSKANSAGEAALLSMTKEGTIKLDWHQDANSISGDMIVNEVNSTHISSIANALKNDPEATLGILTSDGEIPSSYKQIIEDSGISSDRIVKFTPGIIQGSEVDYIIFDVDLVKKFDAIRDKYKALYTFATRSKKGTIIVDSEGFLKDGMKLENNKMSKNPGYYDPLTKDVIDKAKEDRKKKLDEILKGDMELSPDAMFKWKMGKTENVEEDSFDTDSVTPPLAEVGNRFVKVPGNKVIQVKNFYEDDRKKGTIETKDFKLILYSFYKNPNVSISITGNKGKEKVTLGTHRGVMLSDLNIGDGEITMTLEEFRKIEKSWLNLRNELFNSFMSSGSTTLNTTSGKFHDYLKVLFPAQASLFENSIPLNNIELVVTASKYDTKINNPWNKHLDVEEDRLKQDDLFINLSAKININNTIRYVTLATFPNIGTLMSKGVAKAKNPTEVADIIKKTISSINNSLVDNPYVEFKLGENHGITFLTGVRLLRGSESMTQDLKTPKISLSSLDTKFRDAEFSDIRLFPRDLETFRALFKNHYFEYEGKVLDNAEIDEQFSYLKNKPYVIVSFGNSNNLSKILSVYTHSRNVEQLTKEVKKLYEQVQDIIKDKSKNKQKLTIADFARTNVLADSMTNKSNILDLLISWGMKADAEGNSLLDLFTKSYKSDLKMFKDKEFTLLDIITEFRSKEAESKFDPVGRLNDIIKTIQKTIKDNPKLSNQDIKNKLLSGSDSTKFAGKWNDGFHKLFIYQTILDAKKSSTESSLLKGFFGSFGTDIEIDEIFSPDEALLDMAKDMEKLIKAIDKDQKFYYSIPIKPVDGELQINQDIAGLDGFNNPYFDNLFIRSFVESPNVMLPLEIFENMKFNPNPEKSIITEVEEDIEEEVTGEDIITEGEDVAITWTSLRAGIERGDYTNDSNPEVSKNRQKVHLENSVEIITEIQDIIDIINKVDGIEWVGPTNIIENIISNIGDLDYDSLVMEFNSIITNLGINEDSVNVFNILTNNVLINGSKPFSDYETIDFLIGKSGIDIADNLADITSLFNDIC